MKAFLSHSSLDKSFVAAVAHRLTRARVEYDSFCFEPMVDFRDSIREALGRSETLVLFASRHSLSSSWVRYELNSADELVKQGKLKSAVAMIIDEVTTVRDLPAWMRQARIERVRQPTRAARIIHQHLHRLAGIDEQPLFIGRDQIMADFSRLLINPPNDAPPKTIFVTGLAGTGRRAFLQHAFKNFLSLDIGPILTLEPTDGIDTLHAFLLGELGQLDKRTDLEAAIQRFQKAPLRERSKEIARLLAGLAEPGTAPVIVDSGGLLSADGHYAEGVFEIFEELRQYNDTYLAVVHGRKPVVDRERLRDIRGLQFRVPPIDLHYTALLTTQAFRRAGVVATTAEVHELAEYMDGYPPAVYLAVVLVKEYGITTIMADKSKLVDFKIRAFAPLLPHLNLSDADWACLRVLASEPILPFEALSAVLEVSAEATAAQVQRLIDLSLISPRQRNFQISPPIREAVFATRGRLSDAEFGKLAEALESAYWRDSDELPTMDIVSATVHAVSRSNSARLSQFRGLVLPSTLFKAAKETYNQSSADSWILAGRLADQVLELDARHRQARILRFKVLFGCRIGQRPRSYYVISLRVDT